MGVGLEQQKGWDRGKWVDGLIDEEDMKWETGSGFSILPYQDGQSPELHRPWTELFVVVKVLSDITYRVQSEKPKPGRHRMWQGFVVLFNRLKPCQTPAQETQQEGEPMRVKLTENKQTFPTINYILQENQLNVAGQPGVAADCNKILDIFKNKNCHNYAVLAIVAVDDIVLL